MATTFDYDVEVSDDEYWSYVTGDRASPCENDDTLPAHTGCIVITVDRYMLD